MRCGSCGREVEAGSRFCGLCGAPVVAAAVAPRRRSRKGVWITLGLVLAAAGAVVILEATSGKSGSRSGPPAPKGVAKTENHPPQVTRFTAGSSRVGAGGSTELTATIWDPEGDPYHAWWTSSCGVIAPRRGDASRAIFLAPAGGGACTVTVEVQDHEMRRPSHHRYTILVGGGG